MIYLYIIHARILYMHICTVYFSHYNQLCQKKGRTIKTKEEIFEKQKWNEVESHICYISSAINGSRDLQDTNSHISFGDHSAETSKGTILQ